MFGLCFFFFFKQKTAYEMRISDWSSDVCSSDLLAGPLQRLQALDRSGHFHAVVGGKRRAAGEFKLPIALAQDRAPAAGAGIALARAVRENLDVLNASHQPIRPSPDWIDRKSTRLNSRH